MGSAWKLKFFHVVSMGCVVTGRFVAAVWSLSLVGVAVVAVVFCRVPVAGIIGLSSRSSVRCVSERCSRGWMIGSGNMRRLRKRRNM